ncbi:acetyl-CoA carboxylase biotin carboxylase subunit family protein [Paenibacillus dendritiformis]|uniref:ATP-grasp domain-containing protein n=1 Tax=Paenibacillus dendritiformis TaxID=130049 RepID=UPI003656DC8F
MRAVIINQFPQKKCDYEQHLKDVEGEFILLTRKERMEGFNPEFFSEIIGLENFSNSGLVLASILEMHEKKPIDYVIATHEFDLLRAAQLREFLELDGQNIESALAFRDKITMKEACSEVIKLPKFKRINNVIDILLFKKGNGFPFVIKPVDGAASVGVQVMKDEDSFNKFLLNPVTHNMEIESFVDGEMYHVDGLYLNNKLIVSRPSKYINGCLAFHSNMYLGSIMLQRDNPMFERLNKAVHNVLCSLPTPDHAIAFHAEFFHTSTDEIVFCEIASRVGGGKIVEAVKYATGIDILRESVRAQCGIPTDCVETEDRLAGFLFVPPQVGTFVSINENPPFEWVLELSTKKEKIGQTFEGASSSVDNIAVILISGNNEQELKDRNQIIYEWILENTTWKLIDVEEEKATNGVL